MSYSRSATSPAARRLPSLSRPKANRLRPTTSSEVVIIGCSDPATAGNSSPAVAGDAGRRMPMARTTTTGILRITRTRLFHDDLPVHPGMRCADVVVVPRLREGDGLRLAVRNHTGIPVALLPRRRPVRQVADVREVQRAAHLDPDAGRHVAELHVVAAHLDGVDAGRDRPDGPGDGRRRGRRPQRPDLPLQREGPDRITVGAALQLIAAGRDHDELLAIHLVDDGRRIRAEAGLEAPQLLTRLGVDREEVAVGLATEDEAAGRDRRAAATADAVRRLVLPGDLVRLAVDRGERASHLDPDRRRLRAADVALADEELVAVAREGAGADGLGDVEVARVGAVRHRRPVRSAQARRLHDHRVFPEDLEDASGLLVARHRLGTLRHGRVALRVRLRLRRLLPRLLRHRPLLDADQRCAVRAIQDVDPAGPARFGDALAGPAVDHGIEEHDRTGRVVVPDVVMDLLEVPHVLAGLRLQRDHRRAVQVVAFPHRPVVIGPAVAGREVEEAELRIERGRVPDRGAAAHRMVRAGGPGLAATLPRPGQRVPAPLDLAALGVQCGDAPTHAEFAARDAAVHETVVVERRAGDGVAVLPLLDRRLPGHLAGLHVERDDVRVELTEVEQPLAHGESTVDPPAAYGGDLLVDAGPVLPEDLARLGVQREDIVVARDHVHDPVLDEGRGLERVLAADAGALQARHPGALELLDVAGVDLGQRRVALVGEVAAVGDPVLAHRAPEQLVDLRIGRPGRSGEQDE